MLKQETNLRQKQKKNYLLIRKPAEGSGDQPKILGAYSYKSTADGKLTAPDLMVITRKQLKEHYPSWAFWLSAFETEERMGSLKEPEPNESSEETSVTEPLAALPAYRTDLIIAIDSLNDFSFTIPGVSHVPPDGAAFYCSWPEFIDNEYVRKYLKDFDAIEGNYFKVHDVGYTYYADRLEVDFTLILGD